MKTILTQQNKTAASATLHCLTGCAIGEVLGMVITTFFAVAAFPSVVISVVLAFLFGYALSMIPLIKYGLGMKKAMQLALLSDTVSIATMEIVDNAFLLLIPGAIAATLVTPLFWWSLFASLFIAFLAAFPVNRYLIAKGKGHAVVHEYHHGH